MSGDWDLGSEATTTSLVMLAVAFVLSAVVGAERQYRQKNAGLRTHTLVGTGSAAFTLVSVYGFETMIPADAPHDPARVAAQIVTGIGFIGAGVIFTRSDVVRGLTTAASIWVAAAIGMAAGAGMPILAAATTLLHLATVLVLSPLARKVSDLSDHGALEIRYLDGRGVLRVVLETASELGFETVIRSSRSLRRDDARLVEVVARFSGPRPRNELVHALSRVEGVLEVRTQDDDEA